MIVVLLSGWAGSGKDATAGVLSSYGFKRYAFADALKRLVSQEYRFPLEWCHSQQGKLQRLDSAAEKTVREVLIQRGQEIRSEKQNPGYFAELTATEIINAGEQMVVISDWRLKCELQTIKDFFYMCSKIITVRIERTGQTESAVKDSLTEHELDEFPFDVRIENPGTSWEGLEIEIQTTLSPILSKLRDEKV